MAKKTKKKEDNSLDYITLPQIDLDPKVKRGIFVVFILTFAALSLLGLFGLAGVVGLYLAKAMMLVFGWGKWIFPLILFGLGYLVYTENRSKLRGANFLGLFVFIISFQALLHLFVALSLDYPAASFAIDGEALEKWKLSVDIGFGGGYLGLFIASIFVKLVGLWASLIVTAGLLLVSLMLLFNTTLSNLIGRGSWFAKIIRGINIVFIKLFRSGDDSQDEEEASYYAALTQEEAEEDEGLGFTKKKITARGPKEKKAELATAADSGKKDKAEMEITPKHAYVKIDIPFNLLSEKTGRAVGGDINRNQEVIKHTLEKFGIPVDMGEISVGPTVTQYTFKPAEGVKLSRITTLNNDLALSLAAHPIRIEAPIPGKSLVGIEVPNQTKAIVGLKEILSDRKFKERKTNLMVALGKDVAGDVWLYDLARMPHLLVAGATNSGKSVCLNAIIISLLYQNSPDELKFIMVDPKRVELTPYKGIPHMLTPVITEVSKTINALKWCLNEMDRRYMFLEEKRRKNIQDYNASLKEGAEKMPYIVFIIDELADLMVTAARDVEPSIIRLTQMARAVGIHLVLATQRPSVDVITGVIKANMPARIAFSVASGIDSRTILDSPGAEKLLGRGDMLFTTAEITKPKRLQGAFLSDDEIRRVTDYIKDKSGEPVYIEGVTERQKVSGIAGVGIDGGSDDDDELLHEAKEIVINSGKASASYLQRRLSIGYSRAARLLDLLEEAGVIGPSNGAKPREIMVSKEQYENLINEGVSGMSLHSREEAVAPDSYLGSDGEDSDEETDEETPEVFKEEAEDEPEENNGDDTPIHAEVEEPKKKKEKTGEEAGDDFDDGKFFSR